MRTDSLIGVDDAGKLHMRNIDFAFGVEMEFVNLSEGSIFYDQRLEITNYFAKRKD